MQKKVVFSAIIMVTGLLAGCATGFHQYGLTGGYKSQMLSANEAKISFKGNGFSQAQTTYDYAMKAAGELTLQHGFHYFEIVNQRTYIVSSTTYVGAYGTPITAHMPNTDMTIKMLNQKTAKAYDAKKVFSAVAAK